MTVNTVAVIGLGNMGLPMACNLAKAGFRVKGFDLNPPTLTGDTPDRLHVCKQLNEAVDSAELMLTMLPDGDRVHEVATSVFSSDTSPSYLIDCSTIDIEQARTLHQMASKASVQCLDAPVSGGVKGAAAGTLTAMVGGDESLLASLRPVLEPLFGNIIYCGEGGAGQAAKICNNMLLGSTMIAVGETFNLGRSLGLDLNRLYDVVSTSSGACWSVNQYCPVPHIGPESPADSDYRPGFSARMMLKDLRLAQAAAVATGEATPAGQQALSLFEEFVNTNQGEIDFSAIIQYLNQHSRNS